MKKAKPLNRSFLAGWVENLWRRLQVPLVLRTQPEAAWATRGEQPNIEVMMNQVVW